MCVATAVARGTAELELVGVDVQPGGDLVRGVLAPQRAGAVLEVAAGVEFLDPPVVGIGHEDVAGGVDRHHRPGMDGLDEPGTDRPRQHLALQDFVGVRR